MYNPGMNYDLLADLITHNSTIKHLSLLFHFRHEIFEVEMIGKALPRNSSIEVLEIFSETRHYLIEGFYTSLIDGILENKSIRFFCFPTIPTKMLSSFLTCLFKLLSNPCRLQGLDITGLVRDTDGEHFYFLENFWLALELNTSIHTLFFDSVYCSFRVMREINNLLDNNFTLQRVCRVLIDEQNHYEGKKFLTEEIRKKLKRNRRIFLSQKSLNYFLLLRLLFSLNVDSIFFCYFPLDLIQLILLFLIELQMKNFEVLPFFAYEDEYYPKRFFEIIR